jgi:RNA polymerase sigma-70 factor (ECF subfamily)
MNISDKQLIEEYLSGNDGSLEILIKKYLKFIYNFINKNIGSVADAEDITQEVFLKVWKNIKKFDREKDFKPWVFQIAKNTLIDFYRKKKIIPFSSFENEKGQNLFVNSFVGKSINLLENMSDKRTIAVALHNFTDKDTKLINLRNYEGRSFKEISDILQESINTVKSRYRRLIITLSKKIKR